MIPLGYMRKQVVSRPPWFTTTRVRDVYSLSGCVSHHFADYIRHWKHNGYWLFDSPRLIADVAEAASAPLEGTKLFYYEAFAHQFDEASGIWEAFGPEPSFITRVVAPKNKLLEGFDIVSFSLGNSPECSPLSCHAMADDLPANQHCLLGSLEEAKAVIEQGVLVGCEPGPYRIIAVYSVADA